MDTISYFKLQAKNLFRDYKTKKPVFDKVINDYLYEYSPTYFDMDGIVCDFDINEENFSLMKAQHIVAIMAGFNKWADILKASKAELEIAKLLFDNQHKFSLDDWCFFLDGAEELNNKVFDTEEQLALFKEAFIKIEAHHTLDYYNEIRDVGMTMATTLKTTKERLKGLEIALKAENDKQRFLNQSGLFEDRKLTEPVFHDPMTTKASELNNSLKQFLSN